MSEQQQEFRRAILDEPDKLRCFQGLVIESVYGYWNEHHSAAGLKDIEGRFREKVRRRIEENTWWYEPVEKIQKRTIDRRVNEAASMNPLENYFLVDGIIPRIIHDHITQGDSYYRPNPVLFEEETS